MTDAAADVAAAYFDAWKRGDFARLRTILADDASFDGSLGHAGNAEECIAGLERMSEIVTDIVIRKTFADGADVLTWFDLHTAGTGSTADRELAACGERQDHRHPGDLRPAAPDHPGRCGRRPALRRRRAAGQVALNG